MIINTIENLVNCLYSDNIIPIININQIDTFTYEFNGKLIKIFLDDENKIKGIENFKFSK